jgi:hypothetical protein
LISKAIAVAHGGADKQQHIRVSSRSEAALDSSSEPHDLSASLLKLQRTRGNRYVQGLLSRALKGGEAAVSPEVEASIERARGGGRPLDDATLLRMESAFDADFSGVRVHTDPDAHSLNRALAATAFTTGRDIFFRSGAYDPASVSGRRLLTHELTHVVQQNAGMKRTSRAERAVVRRACAECEEERAEGRKVHETAPSDGVARSQADRERIKRASAEGPFIQRASDEEGGEAGPVSSESSQVKEYSRLQPGFDIDVSEGRAFANEAIATMSPYGAKISAPPSDAIASAHDGGGVAAVASNDTAPADGDLQASALPNVHRAGGGSVKPEAGFVGSIQLCYDACNAELSVVGWIWAGGGVVTKGLFGGNAWWGAYVFAEREFLKTKLGFMPTLKCGTCDPACSGKEGSGNGSWGGGIAGFPVALKPGERASLKQAGIEVGALLSPHSLCDANLEIIALIDLTKYLGPVGAAVVAAQELANRLGKRLGIEIECGIGVDVSGDVHLCKSVPGGGILGITSDSAKICGGGYVGCGIGLAHDKSALPGI